MRAQTWPFLPRRSQDADSLLLSRGDKRCWVSYRPTSSRYVSYNVVMWKNKVSWEYNLASSMCGTQTDSGGRRERCVPLFVYLGISMCVPCLSHASVLVDFCQIALSHIQNGVTSTKIHAKAAGNHSCHLSTLRTLLPPSCLCPQFCDACVPTLL